MELKALRTYFYNHRNEEDEKEFVIRIRNGGDIVYYRGIKILEIKKEHIRLSDNVFYLSDAYIKDNKEELDDDNARLNKLGELAVLRNELIKNGCMKIKDEFIIKYKPSSKDAYKLTPQIKLDVATHLKKILELISKELDKWCLKDFVRFEDKYCEVDKDKLTKIEDDFVRMQTLLNIEYIVMNNFINFKDICWTEKGNKDIKTPPSDRSGWQKPKIEFISLIEYNIANINEELLNSKDGFLNKIKGAIDAYLKFSFEEEKNYQHQFMLNDYVLDKFNRFGVNNLYRFEEEYYTNCSDKGRIDTVFVSEDGKDIYLIELKVNDNVIGGTNGIHKHLIDIENLYLEEKIDSFIKELKENVDTRRKEVDEVNINWNNNLTIHFWTVMAYDDVSMKTNIESLLTEYNNQNSIEFEKVKRAITNNKTVYKSRVLPLKDHLVKLSEHKCDVRFFFDIIDYNRKDKKINISDKDFEEYEVK